MNSKSTLARPPRSRWVSGFLHSIVALTAGVSLFFAGDSAWGDLPALIPRDVLFGNPDKASPRVSPDGRMLAYLAPHNEVMNVWVRTLGKTDDRVITSDKKRGIRMFFWRGDSQHILYGQDQDGDENFHIYQTGVETKKTRDLTPFQGVRAMPIAINPDFPDQLLVALNLRDERLFDVHRVNLKTGAVELDTENPGDVAQWEADHEMKVRVAEVQTPEGGKEIRVRAEPGSPWKVFQRWSADESMGGVVGFTPDNHSVWLSSSVDANAARLVQVELASGASKVIFEDAEYDVGGILQHPRKHHLEAVQVQRARSEWTLIDKSLEADFQILRSIRDGDFSIGSRDLEDNLWIVAFVEDDGPVHYYAYDRRVRKADLLFTNRSDLERYTLAKMKPISFQSRDGLTLHGYLTVPPGLEPKNLPLVLNVHGGPWGRDEWGLDNEVQWLANRGYAVLQINFRGSTGYGKKFLNAGDREWAGKMHDDLIDGKRWAIAQGYADPKRVAIMGGSYGGYATLVGLSFTPDEFVCGVDVVGPANLVTLLKTIPPYWVPMKALFKKRVGDLETEEEFLKSRSPVFKAHQIKAPLLIAQGANDPRVKQAESDQIVEAMRKNSLPVKYLVFPDEGHGFARPENRLRYYAAAEPFLATYLKGRSETASEKDNYEALLK